jgi:site-specific DNA-methyltransferase (cytosine-N4-specific)
MNEPTRPLIIQADTRALPLADDSVDLVVTSPPYFGLRSYTDGGEHYDGQIGAEATPAEYVDALIDATREWLRVLKPEGNLWVNLGDSYSGKPSSDGSGRRDKSGAPGKPANRREAVPAKSLRGLPWRYALRCIDDLGLILRAEVIWSKPNGMPESVTDRTRRSHETWFHLTQRPKYFSSVDEIREPHAGEFLSSGARNPRHGRPGGQMPIRRAGIGEARDENLGRASGGNNFTAPLNPLGKLPGSVWEIATQPLRVPAEIGTDHYAAFPIEWPRRIIAAWCPPAGVVLDPFGGTGTTALAADVLGRTGISVDASADYCRIARWRTTDPGERARAMRVPKPEPEMEGQLSLLDALEPAA